LTLWVVIGRLQFGVSLADGGNKKLLKRIRAHGNFAETVPLALLLLVLLELKGLSAAWIVGLGSALLVGRVLHAWSLLASARTWGRITGMVITLFVLSIQAVLALMQLAQL
jgi:uncharacterized protein